MKIRKVVAILQLFIVISGCSKAVACKIGSPRGATILIVTRPVNDPPADSVEGEVYDYSGSFIGMMAIGTTQKKLLVIKLVFTKSTLESSHFSI